MEISHIHLLHPTRKDFKEIRNLLRDGKILLYPCDTCWALTTPLSNAKGREQIYIMKERPTQMSVSMAFSDILQVEKYAYVDDQTRQFITKYMPERVTLLLKAREEMFSSDIFLQDGKIGVRIPKDTFTRKLAQSLGEPIISTSANIHGKPELYSWKEVEKFLSEVSSKPDVVIYKKLLQKNKPSTIMDTTQIPWKVIRQGAFQF